jgi:hypothetical protein
VLNGKYRLYSTRRNWAYTVSLLTPADHDSDTMPDEWETRTEFDPSSAADASADTDGDALRNADEYMADTDPTEAASVCL